MSRFLCGDYEKLVPYTPGEQINDKSYIKLNTNESPFPPSPKVLRAVNSDIVSKLNLYSDPTVKKLKRALADRFSKKSENVFVANGSDDVIAFSIMAFTGRGGELVCPDITYGFYSVYAQLFGVRLTEIPLDKNFEINVEDYVGIGKNIIIANPNAPTGIAISRDDVERIVKSNPNNLVIIDEAYMDFCGDSALALVDRYDNLLITRTFSKSHSLAGLRVGYAIACSDIIADLEKIRYSFNPYNMNSLSIEAATAAIEDAEYYDKCAADIISVREMTKQKLLSLGFTCLTSKANFVFASSEKISGKELYLSLKEKGVLIRYFAKPRIDKFVRISIGTKDDMERVCALIEQIINSKNI